MEVEMGIKDYRIAAGLTQQQFAELFDVSIDTVKAWDCGRRKPDKLKEKLIIEKLEGMRMITEKTLLDNYSQISNGLNYISIINGKPINWDYRRGENGDGYNPAREKREEAEEIYIYNSGEIISLEDGCHNHSALGKMYSDYEKVIYG